MSPTTIEWTDETWNVATGCDRTSPGCDHCYIERTIPFRVEGRRFDEHGKMGVRLHPERLAKPLHWRKPRRVFVNSLSDLFHPDIKAGFIADVFAVMALAPQHSYQILTKRPQRMAGILGDSDRWLGVLDGAMRRRNGNIFAEHVSVSQYPMPWVWLGTSIENDRYTFRADHLRATPAAVRFLSCEPLLGPLPSLRLNDIDWVIAGAESGPGARPMDRGWVRELRDHCVEEGVAFFFKQDADARGHKIPLPELDGRRWLEMP